MEIRQARLEDIEGMKRMDDIFLKADHSIEYFKKNLDDTIVAVVDGKLIGYFMFKDQLAMNMLIHPDYRRRGIGKLLFRKATERSKKFISRTREDNVDAIEFLEPRLQEKPLYLAVSRKVKGHKQIVKDFNHGLKQIAEDGIIHNIIKKHGFD